MQATRDFTAHINGADYSLKQGDEFKGDARAQAHLLNLGLIAKPKKKKEADDER